MEIETLYQHFLHHPIICTDSRKITPGCIFFGLAGENFDGGAFGFEVLKNGAFLAIVHEKWNFQHPNIILVNNPLTVLQQLATFHRNQQNIPVIGITGTNGKTTTKELVNVILGTCFSVHSTAGNLNNHIGVPLTLLGIKKDTEIAVIEMGASHPGEIKELCSIAAPNLGIITSLGKAHLEGFGSFEGIVKTKTELYNWIKSINGLVFYFSGNELLTQHSSELKRISFGYKNEDFIIGELISSNPTLQFKWKSQNSNWNEVSSNMFGHYNLNNMLAAVSIGTYFKIEPKLINEAIEHYIPGNNRSQIRRTANNLLIMDAYNANPTSMEMALNSFSELQSPNKIVILGDMLELGTTSLIEHQKMIDLIGQFGFNEVFLVGENFCQFENAPYHFFKNTIELNKYLEKHRITNSTVLLKGSRGIALEKATDFL
jgi:UDP-N-acetylmuramoyl-tripeptide--D-alanyl-D-alanine ligase